MKVKNILKNAAKAAGVVAVAEIGIAAYFYRRTMIRSKAKVERTMKMAGTDWEKHMPFIQMRKEAMLQQERYDEWITSSDGLRFSTSTYFR